MVGDSRVPCEAYGLDAMSTGVILAWATEAMEKGIISVKETAGMELQWGNDQSYLDAIEKINNNLAIQLN